MVTLAVSHAFVMGKRATGKECRAVTAGPATATMAA
jgi:hypothetical protein